MPSRGEPITARYAGEMTGPMSSQVPQFDFDALYRGESPAEGVPAMTSPPWDTKEPNENVIEWQTGGWVHGDVLDVGCGLGDNAVYLAKNGHPVTGLDISPTALIIAEQRAAGGHQNPSAPASAVQSVTVNGLPALYIQGAWVGHAGSPPVWMDNGMGMVVFEDHGLIIRVTGHRTRDQLLRTAASLR